MCLISFDNGGGISETPMLGQQAADVQPDLTKEQVAQWLNVSKRTVENLTNAGEFVTWKYGRMRRYDPESVRSFRHRHLTSLRSASCIGSCPPHTNRRRLVSAKPRSAA